MLGNQEDEMTYLNIQRHSSPSGCFSLQTHREESLGQETEDADHDEQGKPLDASREDERLLEDDHPVFVGACEFDVEDKFKL